jgi:hypothetical protein
LINHQIILILNFIQVHGATDNSITGVGFQPDWVWIKKRNEAVGHKFYDAVRGGATKLCIQILQQ